MKKILITGCAGFIGSHVSERFLALGWAVIGMDNFDPFYPKEIKEKNLSTVLDNPMFSFINGDIRNLSDYPKEGVDLVLHLAAKAGVRPSIEDPEDYFSVNVTGTQVLHSWMRQFGVKKLLFSSSSSIYGNNKTIPFSETDVVDYPISPYAASKKTGELINHVEHHLYGIDVVNLRFFTVYGPRQRPDLAIHKFVDKMFNGTPIQIYGDGRTKRDYTFIHDICDGLVAAADFIEDFTGFEIVNLGNNSPVELKYLVDALYSATGVQHEVEYTKMQPGDVDITFANTTKAKRLFGYQPKVGIEEGVLSFVSWYKEINNI